LFIPPTQHLNKLGRKDESNPKDKIDECMITIPLQKYVTHLLLSQTGPQLNLCTL